MSVIVTDANKVFTAGNNSAFYATTSFTASIWVKGTADPSNYAYGFGNRNSITAGWDLLWSASTGTSNLRAITGVSIGTAAAQTMDAGSLTINKWYFIASTWDGTSLIIYSGDETTPPTAKGTTALAGTMGSDATTDLYFGVSELDPQFKALKISDARIYNNTVRTQANLQSDYLTRLVGTETGLTDYWKFSEGAGNTAANSTSSRNATAIAASWDLDNPLFTTSSATTYMKSGKFW